MQIEIHNDPMPAKKIMASIGRPISPIGEALRRLEIGQCFYLPYSFKTLSSVSSLGQGLKNKFGKKFATRKIYKDNEALIGVWRKE